MALDAMIDIWLVIPLVLAAFFFGGGLAYRECAHDLQSVADALDRIVDLLGKLVDDLAR
jgi:hypothetical protein